jgi:hypothetical protein
LESIRKKSNENLMNVRNGTGNCGNMVFRAGHKYIFLVYLDNHVLGDSSSLSIGNSKKQVKLNSDESLGCNREL